MQSTTGATGFGFRPLRFDDMQMFHDWVHLPHVIEWWAEDARPLDELIGIYGPDIEGTGTTHGYIVERSGKPFGYIQWYRLGDEPEWMPPMIRYEPTDVAVDLLIGDPDGIGRGLGAEMLQTFLRDIVFVDAPDAAHCWIDPDPPNRRAVRAYTKAGFGPVAIVERVVEGKPEVALVMRLTRTEALE